MVEAWLYIFSFLLAPFLFISGFYFGKYHLKYLVFNGGEDSYPRPIPSFVKGYRKEFDGELIEIVKGDKND